MSKLVALRIPDDLFVELEKAKGAEGMNLSQIIISVLRETFGAESPKPEKMIIAKPKKRAKVEKPVEIPKAIERESLKVEPAQVVPRRFVSCPECGSIGGMHQRKCSKG